MNTITWPVAHLIMSTHWCVSLGCIQGLYWGKAYAKHSPEIHTVRESNTTNLTCHWQQMRKLIPWVYKQEYLKALDYMYNIIAITYRSCAWKKQVMQSQELYTWCLGWCFMSFVNSLPPNSCSSSCYWVPLRAYPVRSTRRSFKSFWGRGVFVWYLLCDQYRWG